MKLRLNSFKKVGKERIVFFDFFRNENGKAVRQDFQINREGRTLFTIYICYEFFFPVWLVFGLSFLVLLLSFRLTMICACMSYRSAPFLSK